MSTLSFIYVLHHIYDKIGVDKILLKYFIVFIMVKIKLEAIKDFDARFKMRLMLIASVANEKTGILEFQGKPMTMIHMPAFFNIDVSVAAQVVKSLIKCGILCKMTIGKQDIFIINPVVIDGDAEFVSLLGATDLFKSYLNPDYKEINYSTKHKHKKTLETSKLALNSLKKAGVI